MKNILIIAWCILLLGCGSKKKTLEVNKSTYKENKDLSVFQQKNELSVITFTKDASEMIIEPNVPDKPLIVGKDTIHNAKRVIWSKKNEKMTEQVTGQVTELKVDKGNIESSNESTKKEKEEQGADTGDIKWTVWGIIIIAVAVFVIGKWKKWF
ncbi:hypothetical protein [Flagellimonas sp.]|uniref:hypothetical protein n=1 Tax=Flagellimonas sp. TaxID=2058762 RepID=UPI003BAC339D